MPAPTYTDGTEVAEGDRIRYHQQPGGLLPPPRHFVNGEWTLWTEGVAVTLDIEKYGESLWGGPIWALRDANGRHSGIMGHVIERIE